MLTTIEKYLSSSKINHDRVLSIMGHVVCFILMYWSVIYFKERLLTIDSAYYTFKIIYQEGFNIEHKRWLALPTQVLPLLALKLGLSLKQFMVCYSLSFMLFYYVIYNIITHLFKKPATGIFLLLALVLCARNKYYDAVSEVMLSMAFAALIIAWLQSRTYPLRKKDWLVGILLGIVFALGHPIIYLPLLGFIFVLFVYDKKFRNPSFVLFGLLQIVIGFLRITYFTDGYEAGKMDALRSSKEVLSNIHEYYVFGIAKDFIQIDCYWAYALFAAGVIWLFIKEKYLTALASFLGFFIFFLMTVVILHKGESNNMMENYFIIFGFFLAIPIFFAFCKFQKWNIPALIIVAFLFKENLTQLESKHEFFSGRIDYLRHLIDTPTQDKLIYKKNNIIWESMQVPWGTPFESILLSSLEKETSKSLFIINDEDQNLDSYLNSRGFLGPEWAPHIFELEQINKHYFKLSSDPYHLVTEAMK